MNNRSSMAQPPENRLPVYKIAITGPESTGKSTLAKRLADHYKTIWVEEYARNYLHQLGRPYEESDLLTIAIGQIENEKKNHEKASRFLFCDTELIVLKIWSEHKYQRIDEQILELHKQTHYHHYLLMNIDLPWVFDPLREHPDHRLYFFKWFIRELAQKNASFSIISGAEDERLKNAIEAIDRLFPN
ncbi:MAG: ATP-binding protein [Cyclobacteriaceae bacterium]|nr:ATP-binding protein [Cyclobacteriaceae bacterium]